MSAAVLKYDAALRAIAEAKTVDEVTDWIDKAAAIREYGRRIKDRRMELDAIEIRVIARRRRGELLAAMKDSGHLAVGKTKLMSPETDMVTLEDLGLTRNESSEEQKLAAMPIDAFERLKARCRAYAEEHPEKHSFDILQEDRSLTQRESRRELAQALSDTSLELKGSRTFPCIYLDPAWSRKAGIGGRAYENHYPTQQWDSIIETMKIAAQRLQPDAWAFIWVPRAHMLALHPVKYKIIIDDGSTHEIEIRTPLIWAIARALGATDYSTCFIWTKTDEDHPDEHGTGLICWDQDEILCLYKKGHGLPMPAGAAKFGSNHRERSRPLGHSRKPQFYREMIAAMTGGLPVLELFARHDQDHPLPANWESWGNESTPAEDIPHDPETGEVIEDESQAKATKGKTGTAEVEDLVRRSTAGTGLQVGEASADLPATSEHMDVTAGETAPHSFPDDDLLVVKPLRASGFLR